MKKIQIIIAIIVGLLAISGAGWKFYDCKADKESVLMLADDLRVYKLENYRRYLQERIWAIERQYPNSYQNMIEYRRLVEELRQLDIKIQAYYRRHG